MWSDSHAVFCCFRQARGNPAPPERGFPPIAPFRNLKRPRPFGGGACFSLFQFLPPGSFFRTKSRSAGQFTASSSQQTTPNKVIA